MKKTIAILLVLAIASVGLFAMVAADPTVNDDKKPAAINIYTDVKAFSAFGVSSNKVADKDFNSIARFQEAVQSSIDTKVDMLSLHDFVDVGFLSGVNNTKGKVDLSITVDQLVSGDDTVNLVVSPKEISIDPSKNSKFGTLENLQLKVKESKRGAAALAPAGKYSTTVTISLITVS